MAIKHPIIRQISTSYDGLLIAAAEFERRVQIWNIESQKRVAQLDTTLDYGGKRLAISRDGSHCAIGAYHVHGIAMYDIRTAMETWRRKDLKKIQSIRFSKDGQSLLCGFDRMSFQSLNSKTGKSRRSIPGTSDMFESIYEDRIIVDRKRRDFQLIDSENRSIATVPRTTFAALDFAFGPQKLCITESGGSIRCFETVKGQQIWEHNPGIGVHALHLTFNEAAQMFAAVVWPYEKGGHHRLVTLNQDQGEVIREIVITDAHEFAFCDKGSVLLTSDGKIRSSATGEVKGALDF